MTKDPRARAHGSTRWGASEFAASTVLLAGTSKDQQLEKSSGTSLIAQRALGCSTPEGALVELPVDSTHRVHGRLELLQLPCRAHHIHLEAALPGGGHGL
eukprot:CAMPEP_0204560820 /NCGR_PEP_ID=MMETSP0661-20131031/32837_1 /ASSEMBLY_ACC=CAM_ASM_000606 /TAXON_ID=109239 /ORGANISM="Alexandrium margalefi, Strain AMGDE01CS-322" /LENGTH=99 /DNA_ID=CAMNT_0051568183 /DNA_START=316 /DNA_END=611 /DNA_ORIENTATION=+